MIFESALDPQYIESNTKCPLIIIVLDIGPGGDIYK